MNIVLPRIPHNLPAGRQLRQLIELDETIATARFHGDDLTQVVTKNFNASELRLEKINCTEAKLEKTVFSDVEILNCDLIATGLSEASWRRVVVKGSRSSGVQLQSSTLKDVSFIDCKLNFANFRYAKLSNVAFENCIVAEADFYAAELRSVRFERCVLDKTQFSGVKLHQVDLRTSDIASLSGIGSLAGAIIDSLQLISLAPLLARELKIHISDN